MQEQILAELEESYAAARRVPGADDYYWNAWKRLAQRLNQRITKMGTFWLRTRITHRR
jgi:hypothetical protein